LLQASVDRKRGVENRAGLTDVGGGTAIFIIKMGEIPY